MAAQHLATYNVVRNPDYERTLSLLDKLGYSATDEEEAVVRPSAVRIAVARAAPKKKKDPDPQNGEGANSPPRLSAQAQAEHARLLVNPVARVTTAWDDVGAPEEIV